MGTNPPCANLVIHGTTPDVPYELFSREQLTNETWLSEGIVLGAPDTNCTPTAVAVGARTNSLFLWCRSWGDSTGSGIPDWWWLQYFGTNWLAWADPYGDPDGDGWSNIQEYQNGTSPIAFDTPPPLQNVTARLDTGGRSVVLTWAAARGPVLQYGIEDWAGNEIARVDASTLAFTTNLCYSLIGDPYTADQCYRVRALYTNNLSVVSQLVDVRQKDISVDVRCVSGSLEQQYLMVSSLPPNLARVRISWDPGNLDACDDFPGFDVPAASLANGIAQLPPDQLTQAGDNWLFAQAVSESGQVGVVQSLMLASSAGNGFVNAAAHMKENLKFLLRAATPAAGFQYTSNLQPYDSPLPTADPSYMQAPETHFARPSSSAEYEYYGFHTFSQNLGHSFIDAWRPVQDNYLWRNFVYEEANFDASGCLVNGAGSLFSNPELPVLYDPVRYAAGDQPTNSPSVALTNNNSTFLPADYVALSWTFPPQPPDAAYLGLQATLSSDVALLVGVSNVYGLPIDAVLVHGDCTNDVFTLSAGGAWGHLDTSAFAYPRTPVPDLRTLDYYFAAETSANASWAMPGSPGFTVTDISPPLIASFGQAVTVQGWARQAISNGWAGKFAYLEQYFDQAYVIGAGGVATTNSAGLLSPYGEFLPTQPGLVALATMADIERGQRGTGVVSVIKLQLDVNHDGIMDLSFAGPDNTSWQKPFLLWVNSDHDEPGTGGNPDKDLPVPPNLPDHTYGAIRCQRNLEDFARLWVCGLPKLPPNQGYTVTLTMSPSSANPAINLYAAITNSAGYLSDTNAAAAQFTKTYLGDQLIFDYSKKLATINASQSYTLPLSSDGTPQYTNFLFEGVVIGACQLTLTISQATGQGSNVLAQTSAWIDLHDVQDFFEQPRASDVSLNDPPTTNAGAFTIDAYTTASDASEDKQIIIFVHGINNSPWDYENTSETMFKRLYWQGYHGRFAAFRWSSPTWSVLPTSNVQISYLNFNKGEYIAYQSAAALNGYIANLRSRFPGYTINLMTHSLGAAVGNQAVRLGAQVDNYAMCQGAMSAWAFDGSNTNLIYSYLAAGAGGTPDADALGGYNNAFNDSTRRVNLYNEQDWALFSGFGGIWEGNQLNFRPDSFTYVGGFSYRYSFDGTNCFLNGYDNEGHPILSRTVTQDYEKKAYVARSRTKAVGAAGLVNAPHALTGGSVSLNVNLQGSSLGFVGGAKFIDTRPEHSGEFTKNIQNTVPFYQQLLQTGFQISPNP